MFCGNSEYIQQPRQNPRNASSVAQRMRIPNTITPAFDAPSTNSMVALTEKPTPKHAANTFGALSTIFFGRFKPETTPRASVASGLYSGLTNARLKKFSACTSVMITAVFAEESSAVKSGVVHAAFDGGNIMNYFFPYWGAALHITIYHIDSHMIDDLKIRNR